MSEAGLRAVFPLWGHESPALARAFVADGFRATPVAVDGTQVSHELLGRAFDAALLADLPDGADPCGENGEFHTFVTAGPVLSAPLAVRAGARRTDGRFAWLSLTAAGDPGKHNAITHRPSCHFRCKGSISGSAVLALLSRRAAGGYPSSSRLSHKALAAS